MKHSCGEQGLRKHILQR